MMTTEIQFKAEGWQGMLLAKMRELGWQFVCTPFVVESQVEAASSLKVTVSSKMGFRFNRRPATQEQWHDAMRKEYAKMIKEFPELGLSPLES